MGRLTPWNNKKLVSLCKVQVMIHRHLVGDRHLQVPNQHLVSLYWMEDTGKGTNRRNDRATGSLALPQTVFVSMVLPSTLVPVFSLLCCRQLLFQLVFTVIIWVTFCYTSFVRQANWNKLSFIFTRLLCMEFVAIIMHITTQQMKGILILLHAVGKILQTAACAGELKLSCLTRWFFPWNVVYFILKRIWKQHENVVFHMIKFISHSRNRDIAANVFKRTHYNHLKPTYHVVIIGWTNLVTIRVAVATCTFVCLFLVL